MLVQGDLRPWGIGKIAWPGRAFGEQGALALWRPFWYSRTWR